MDSNKKNIVRFGCPFPNGDRRWYETSEGIRVNCDDETIDKLWTNWVCKTEGIKKEKILLDNETIFEFYPFYEIDLNTPPLFKVYCDYGK